MRWSPTSQALAVAAASGIALYSLSANELMLRGLLEGHGGPVKSVAVNQDGSQVVSASSDTTVRVWNLRDGGAFSTLAGHTHSVNSVALHGNLLASADQTIRLWDIKTGQVLQVFAGHTDEITSVVFGGANRLVSASWDSTARLWDIASGQTLAILPHDDWVREVACSSTHIATASKDMTVRLWDIVTGTPVASMLAHDAGADTVSFSPDGSLLASGGRDNRIKIWHDHQLVAELDAHTKPVLSVAFSPDGLLLASGSGDNTLRIWGIPF